MDTKSINDVNGKSAVSQTKESIAAAAMQDQTADGALAAESAPADISEETELSESEKKALFYEACYRLGNAKAVSELYAVEQMLLQIGDYEDRDKRLEQCREKMQELELKQQETAAAEARRLEKLRGEYTQMRDEAKRSAEILKKRDAAKKLRETAEKLSEGYSEIEGAEDYAREFSAKAAQLEKEYERRQGFEKKSCAAYALIEIAAAALYLLVFAAMGDKFSPLVPLTVCDCIMAGGFMIGYFCESSSGAAVSLFAALDFILMIVGTVALCALNKLALGFVGYIKLISLPIVIGLAVGTVIYIVWSRFAARSEKESKNKSKG